jgi:hypothetical protein
MNNNNNKQNECIFDKKSELKLLKLAPLKNNHSIFCALIEVDISTYKKAMSVRHCLIGLDSCTIYDAVEVSKCFNCNGFNHSSHKCKSALSCSRCAKDHAVKDCKDCAGVFHLACVRVSKALFAVMKTEDKVRSWVCVGCSSGVTSPIPNIEQSVDNMFNLTSTVLSDTAGNTIKTDVLLPPFLPDSNTLNNVPDAFKNVFSEFSGTIYKYFEIFGASMRYHFNSLNGQLADLRKENSLLRTEIQKLTDKLSQKELLQNKSQDLPLSNVLSYADTIKRCASVVVMPK